MKILILLLLRAALAIASVAVGTVPTPIEDHFVVTQVQRTVDLAAGIVTHVESELTIIAQEDHVDRFSFCIPMEAADVHLALLAATANKKNLVLSQGPFDAQR